MRRSRTVWLEHFEFGRDSEEEDGRLRRLNRNSEILFSEFEVGCHHKGTKTQRKPASRTFVRRLSLCLCAFVVTRRSQTRKDFKYAWLDLEVKLQRELDDSWVHRRPRDHAERRRGNVVIRVGKLWRVERIEELRPELDVPAFS